MRRLELAGAAAAGKTTVCRLLAVARGARCVEVEAPGCWRVGDPVERQRCFLERFTAVLRGCVGVCSNSLLTVAAYSLAVGLPEAAWEALERLQGPVVALAVEPAVLAARVAARLAAEPGRRASRVEPLLRLHVEAQRWLLRLAGRLGVHVVWTTRLSPLEAAAAVARAAGW